MEALTSLLLGEVGSVVLNNLALLALPDTPETADRMKTLLPIVQPGWNVLTAVDEIHTSVTRWRGFDEARIFKAMSGLSPIAAKVLPDGRAHV